MTIARPAGGRGRADGRQSGRSPTLQNPRDAEGAFQTERRPRGRRLVPVPLLALAAMLALASRSAGSTDEVAALPLLPNGGFEVASPTNAAQPAGWDRPDGLGVQWTEAPADSPGSPGTDGRGRAIRMNDSPGTDSPGTDGRGRAIRMNTAISEKDMVARWRAQGLDQWDIPNPSGGPVAATYGLSFYSDPIPVRSNQAYRITFDFRGAGGGAKVWVRAYGQYQGEKRRRFETIVNPHGAAPGAWKTFSQCFHPTRLRPECAEMRVMLYAYWPPGVFWFDNVRIEPVTDDEYRRDMGMPR